MNLFVTRISSCLIPNVICSLIWSSMWTHYFLSLSVLQKLYFSCNLLTGLGIISYYTLTSVCNVPLLGWGLDAARNKPIEVISKQWTWYAGVLVMLQGHIWSVFLWFKACWIEFYMNCVFIIVWHEFCIYWWFGDFLRFIAAVGLKCILAGMDL
jgi:hypothetical protein